ncbi:hypothetical protein INR49_022769, partial [Caranx melampygus]
ALEAALPAVSSPTCREEPRFAVRQVDRKQPRRAFLTTLRVRQGKMKTTVVNARTPEVKNLSVLIIMAAPTHTTSRMTSLH